jgi:regulatory protein
MGKVAVEGRAKRERTPKQALEALMRQCARAERSSGDALRLMRGWGIGEGDMQQILQRLISERYIDDRRYAAAFVRDKINLSTWGSRKIAVALSRKGVESQIIKEALAEYDAIDDEGRLEALLRKKMARTKASSPFDLRAKLMRYAASQGYKFDVISSCIAKLTQNAGGEDDEAFM